jgi:hypothetical protein
MNTERNYVIGGIIVLIILVGGVYLFSKNRTSTGSNNATSTGANATSTGTTTGGMILPYGRATIGVGETAKFRGISITPMSVIEDSRCPEGVQCIQAGTVRVNVRSTFDNGSGRQDPIRLGSSTTVNTFAITLVTVEPRADADTEIDDNDYEFTFEVRQSAVVDNELIGK